MQRENKSQVYVAFDSPETAARVTGGDVHEVSGRAGQDKAFILTDEAGRNFVYVRAEYSGYRGVANKAAGEKISAKGEDADHAGSKTVNSGNYVLLARVPKSANRSAGSVEKITTLDGQFNRAASSPAPGGGTATPMSARQAEKLSGKVRSEYDVKNAENGNALADPNISHALMQSSGDQKRIDEMKGHCIVRGKGVAPQQGYTGPIATGVTGPWDKRKSPAPEKKDVARTTWQKHALASKEPSSSAAKQKK